MATQKGLIQLEGSIGGINFYFRKGKAVARRSGGGFNGAAIKTKDSMVRVRENGSEFGAVSKIKKLLRLSIQESLLYCKDSTLHARMMSKLQGIKSWDAFSERGKRTVWKGLATSYGSGLLMDFLFTSKNPVFSHFDGIPLFSEAGTTCDLSRLHFQKSMFKKSATHAVLTYFVVDYDVAKTTFTRYLSPQVHVTKKDEVEALGVLVVNDLPLSYSHRLAFLGVQFYQNHNGSLLELKEEGMTGLRCVGVFVTD
jgi:hypothetical protein